MDRGYFAAEHIELEYEPVQAYHEALAHSPRAMLERPPPASVGRAQQTLARARPAGRCGRVWMAPSRARRRPYRRAKTSTTLAGCATRRVCGSPLGQQRLRRLHRFTPSTRPCATVRAHHWTTSSGAHCRSPTSPTPGRTSDRRCLPAGAGGLGRRRRGVAVPIITGFFRLAGRSSCWCAGPTFPARPGGGRGLLAHHLRCLATSAGGFQLADRGADIERYTTCPRRR